jgi:hypothetical protein
MAITRNDVDEVYSPDGTVTRTPVTRDVTAAVNADALRQAAADALATNRTYVGLATPTAAQTTAQVKALSRQVNALIRLALGQLDGTD